MVAKISRLVMASAAASLVFVPIAASANTRATDNTTVYAASAPGKGREAEGEKLVAPGILLAIIAAAAAAGVIVIIDDDDDQSPGAN
ncbi:MAG: hypothetical protein AAGA34_07145 [Pseudomonadota bacterium]